MASQPRCARLTPIKTEDTPNEVKAPHKRAHNGAQSNEHGALGGLSEVSTFFKTIKAALLWQRAWETRRHSEIATFEYVNGIYNPRKRRLAVGWKTLCP